MDYERIRTIRRMKDLTGEEVANKLGISAQYYYNIERGRRKLSAENAVKLAEVFEVSLSYLLGDRYFSALDKVISESDLNTFIKNLIETKDDLDDLVLEKLKGETRPDVEKTSSEPKDIAAHHNGEDWTEDELEEIERFKEFVRSKRKQQE